jgi:hypothetical protein
MPQKKIEGSSYENMFIIMAYHEIMERSGYALWEELTSWEKEAFVESGAFQHEIIGSRNREAISLMVKTLRSIAGRLEGKPGGRTPTGKIRKRDLKGLKLVVNNQK